MKLLKRLLCMTAVFALFGSIAAGQTASAQEYTYKVRIYAGQQGSIVSAGGNNGKISGSGDVLVCDGYAYGGQIVFHNNMVSLNDNSKYYVKGIRQSGKGTDEVSETGNSMRTAAFKVTKDQDFVVAYGVLTEPVQYTINYHNAAGQELAPSESYYGNVGDRPVIAYQYIEGYQPQAYNLTKTLSADPAENVFTFIYSPLPENTVYTNTTTTVVTEPNPTVTTPPAGGTATSSAAPTPPPTDVPDNSAPLAAPEDQATPVPEPTVRPPLDNWNLDDGDVPLADFEELGLTDKNTAITSDGKMFWNTIPLAAKIAGGVVMLGGFSVAMWLLIFRRRRKDEQ